MKFEQNFDYINTKRVHKQISKL